MKKIAIITMYGNKNFGNKLQNYALEKFINANLKLECETLINYSYSNNINQYYVKKIKKMIKKLIKHKENSNRNKDREKSFIEFNNNINYNKKKITIKNARKFNYDYFVVGSDQVWNPYYGSLSDLELLSFADDKKRISYAASFGVSKLPEEYKYKAKKELLKFKAISVRENEGKKIVEGLTSRKDVKVLVDPTMLLTEKEWDKVIKKPNNFKEGKKYILNYFLGELPIDVNEEIKRVAKENDCYIINILDKNDPFYICGPGEFLYLEKNAFLICTDSFHSSVFAILYNVPFVVFQRKEKDSDINNMGSRLDTLLNKFGLEERYYKNKIESDFLKMDNTEIKKILVNERKKTLKFLEDALK